MRVRAYIDGFNLYYGGVASADAYQRSTGTSPAWKWLDVEALCERLVTAKWPTAVIDKVEYFTARIKPRYPGHSSPTRQDVYIRALERRGIDVVPGHFLIKTKRRPLLASAHDKVTSQHPPMAWVQDSEEKGSDVNLATRLLVEHFRDGAAYDAAVIISNDSDLKMPVAVVRSDGRPVGVLNPHRMPVEALWPKGLAAPHFGRRIEFDDLLACQLPDPLTDRNGKAIVTSKGAQIRRPVEWA